jgi:hypothetical protein
VKRRIHAAFGRISPADTAQFARDVDALSACDGLIFLDPEDGVHPVHLAHLARRARPDVGFVLPLVSRDCNRSALMGLAHTACDLGADGLLLLSGHLDAENSARPVYELDPLQMLALLRDAGVELEAWVASRCATAAERARVASHAQEGARRCLVPWAQEDSPPEDVPLPAVLSVAEADWQEGHLPDGPFDLLLQLSPGNGARAAACAAELRSRAS